MTGPLLQQRQCFNPRPARKHGATRERDGVHVVGRVSIRAPHASTGRQREIEMTEEEALFQSAPRTQARGDQVRHRDHAVDAHVSIRAPHASTGRHPASAQRYLYIQVSIRAPHASTGRPSRRCLAPTAQAVSIRAPHASTGRLNEMVTSRCRSEFQSAPRTQARGDRCWPKWNDGTRRFQSAPRTQARGDASRRSRLKTS